MNQIKKWKLFTILFLLIAVSIISYVGWQQRQLLLGSFTNFDQKVNLDNSLKLVLSQTSQKQLKQFVDTKNWIAGINVNRIDFTSNTREVKFYYFKDALVETAWAEFELKYPNSQLFGQDESINQRLVNLINGQFQCARTSDTQFGMLIPVINQYSFATCLVPIPPSYGSFIGFISVFIRQQPTGAEILELEKITQQISLDIYQRDVLKLTQTFGETLK